MERRADFQNLPVPNPLWREDYNHTDFQNLPAPNTQIENFAQQNRGIAPVSSSKFIGIGSKNFVSNRPFGDSGSHVGPSSKQSKFSSKLSYKSSHDIHVLLETHPSYQKLSGSNSLDRIVAAVASGLLIAGGVTLILVTAGTATPGVILAANSIISAGTTGLFESVSSESFNWTNFSLEIAKSVGMTIITFSTGYLVGQKVAGLAIQGQLTGRTVKVLATSAGMITGAGIRTGSIAIIDLASETPLNGTKLLLEGIFGALEGGSAAYLAAKASLLNFERIPPVQEITQDGILITDSSQNTVSDSLENATENSLQDEILDFSPDVEIREVRTKYFLSTQVHNANPTQNATPNILSDLVVDTPEYVGNRMQAMADAIHFYNGQLPNTSPSQYLTQFNPDWYQEFARVSQNWVPSNPFHLQEVPTAFVHSTVFNDREGILRNYLTNVLNMSQPGGFNFTEYDLFASIRTTWGNTSRELDRGVLRIVRENTTGLLFGTTDHYRTFFRLTPNPP